MNSLPENDLVLGGIDQLMPVDNLHIDVLSRIDEMVEQAVANQDLGIIETGMAGLVKMSQVSGIGLAKFLYVTKFQWDNFNRRDTWLDWAMDNRGVVKATVDRYYRVWAMLVSGDIPREYAKKFETFPIGCLIPIGTLWGSEKYEISTQQWLKLSNAPDPTTIRKIIREIKKVEEKKNTLTSEWDADAKKLTFWKNGKPGVVYLQYDETDDTVSAGLARLFSGRTMEV